MPFEHLDHGVPGNVSSAPRHHRQEDLFFLAEVEGQFTFRTTNQSRLRFRALLMANGTAASLSLSRHLGPNLPKRH